MQKTYADFMFVAPHAEHPPHASCRYAIALAISLCLVWLPSHAQSAAQSRGALLPESQAAALLKQCSRPTPTHVDGHWKVPATAIETLERDLPKLTSIKSGMFGDFVSEPSAYFRQYAGITIRGKRFIYISAVRMDAPLPNWRTEPTILCDGGTSAWGALYDPATRGFSQFEFNGMI